MTQFAQQRVILHVARADLEDVAVATDDVDLADVHDFRDQLHVFRVRRIAQQSEAFFAQPLKAVRRATGLERATAVHLRAGLSDRRRGRADLTLVLRRARPGHDNHFVAADPDVAGHDGRVVGLERPAGQLERLGNPHHLVDAVEHLDETGVGLPLPDRAEHRSGDTGRAVHVHPHFNQPGDDLFDLGFAGPFFHYYDHGFCCLP